MSYVVTTPIGTPQSGFIDYKEGDVLINDSGVELGVCTGFTHEDTCVLIDGKCWGGKFYFHKSNIEDAEFEIII